jgi:hypothetical protein
LITLQKTNLESLLKKAKEHENKYEWLQAAKAYEKASTSSLANKDFIQITMIEEQRSYCFYRAALQATTNENFRLNIKL